MLNFRQIFEANSTTAAATKKNSIIAAPVGRRPTSSLSLPPFERHRRALPRPLSSGLDPFKWSQCNRTISTSAQAFHSGYRRRRNNLCPGYLLVTTVTNAIVRIPTIPHRRRITFKSRFRRCCLRVVDCIKWMEKTVSSRLLAQTFVNADLTWFRASALSFVELIKRSRMCNISIPVLCL